MQIVPYTLILILALSWTSVQAQDHHECSSTCSHHKNETEKLDTNLVKQLQSKNDLPRLIGFFNAEIPIVFRHNAKSTLEYYVLNFWKYYPFNDKSLIKSPYPSAMIQAFVGNLLGVDTAVLNKAVDQMLTKAAVNKDVYIDFTEVFERYILNFFPDNLSFHLQKQLIDHRQQTNFYSQEQMTLWQQTYQKRQGSQVGMLAPDMTVLDAKLKPFSIFQAKEPIFILVFADLESQAYSTWYQECQKSLVPEAQSKGYLKVLNVFIGDAKAYKKMATQFKERATALVPTPQKSNIPYLLKEDPTVYVLDAQREILLINPSFDQLNELIYDCWMYELKE